MLACEVSNKTPGFGTLGVSQGIIGIEPDRLIEVTDSFAIVLEIPTLEMEVALKVCVVRFHTRRRSVWDNRIFGAAQCQFQRGRNSIRDFGLHRKYILEFTLKRP